MNITPYATGGMAFKRPYEAYYDDPVYDVHDADDDGQIDNPGNILYYMPTRTNQSDSYNVSLGVSATWSRPLDKKLQDQCKQAAQASINQMVQLTANKRLDFELARLKNCGELKKSGIMFHPKSPYFSVCADVVVTAPGGKIMPHEHQIPQPSWTNPTSSQPSSESVLPDSDPSEQPDVPEQKEQVLSSPVSFLPWLRPSLSQVSPPSGANPLDPTGVGGGNIGVGSVPTTGEAQFSSPNNSPQGTGEQ